MMRRTLGRGLALAFFCFFGCLMTTRTAQAYIDPATTSYVIQIVAGVVIACGAAVGVFWKKIKLAFSKRKLERLESKLKKQAEDE